MIPILYESTEKTFRSNGFGGLKDAISCKVTEKINGTYELEMEYPVDGLHFEDIKESRLIYAVPREGANPEPFEIYRIGEELKGKVTVYAWHITYKLNMIPVRPFTAQSPSQALMHIESHAVSPIEFTLTADTSRTGAYSLTVPKSARAVIGELVSKYKLEVEWTKDRVQLKDRRGADNGVKVAYSKNLISASHDSDISETVTGILPYWTGFEAGSNQTKVIIGDNVITDTEHVDLYPYNHIISYDFSNWFEQDYVPTKADLETAAAQYLANYHTGLADESTTFNFAPLWMSEEYKSRSAVERISIGDTVHVVSENIKLNVVARVVEATWNVLKERYDSLICGKAKNDISQQIQTVKDSILEELPSKTDLQIAIEEATDLITGNKGGFIQIKKDAEGKPYEFLIMDTEDEQTATNVWRFNQSGFGHSSTGYNGPYTLAMTQDGKIVADFITTGTLNAGVIKAGMLRDSAGKNYWNLDTGEFSLQSGAEIGGKTINQYLNDSLTQKSVFNALTNNGQTQGIYLSGGKIYINASYIKSGTIDSDYIDLHDEMAVYYEDYKGKTYRGGVLGSYDVADYVNMSYSHIYGTGIKYGEAFVGVTRNESIIAGATTMNGSNRYLEILDYSTIRVGSYSSGLYTTKTGTYSFGDGKYMTFKQGFLVGVQGF
jgi:phage minor structural protein